MTEIKRRGKTHVSYDCKVCDYTCKKIDAYRNHYFTRHPGIDVGESEPPKVVEPVEPVAHIETDAPELKIEAIASDIENFISDETPGETNPFFADSTAVVQEVQDDEPFSLKEVLAPGIDVPERLCEITYGLESIFPDALAGYKDRLESHKDLHLRLLKRNGIGNLDSLPFANLKLSDRAALYVFHVRELVTTFFTNRAKKSIKPLTEKEISKAVENLTKVPVIKVAEKDAQKYDFLNENDAP